MKKYITTIKVAAIVAALMSSAPISTAQSEQKSTGWGDFKLFLDPGHSAKENRGLWGYSEAQKVFGVAQYLKGYLLDYTDISADNLKLCRENEVDIVDLEERSDMANAWGADFFYSIHSDASADQNTTVTLFGGWRNNGVDIEKTPNGGKAFGEILNPNLTGVMRITTRGNWYDRCYYDRTPATHTNQYPYLSVNRRTNMASLLSEGGYHTIASQQQLNINKDYKRLEAFAAFQSILKYRGMTNPVQTFLTGIITNSENDVPIDGVTVAVDGKTYVTDTWESTFKTYTNNPDLIHNGFYLFEGIEAGKVVEVTFTADGYDTVTKTVTIKSNPEGQSNDNVTWLDVSMTSNAPARVSMISVEDTKSVKPVEPLVITFSRKMDKASVNEAFSIDNGGDVTLTWINDYTLSINVSKLEPTMSYTITIDGSIAKNSQTGQFFDGDGDGVEGGNYVLPITMSEIDDKPAEVVSTDPVVDGTVEFTLRPVVRIEYNEQIDWNEDKYGDFVSVNDPEGNLYPGTLTHSIIDGVSVLHYFFDEDLPLDKCFLVTVKAGLADLSGNLTERFQFRFLSEYRSVVSTTELLPLTEVTGFWAPDGSGSSSGLTQDANSFTQTNIGVDPNNPVSVKLTYDFDENFTGSSWQIREYNSAQNVNGTSKDGVLTFWLYGDGSNNRVSAALRVRTGNKNGGIKYNLKPIDYRGWHLVSWDFVNDEYQHFTGSDELGDMWRLDSFFLKHELTDEDDETVPYQKWRGEICFNKLAFTKFDNTAVRTAQLSDMDGVEIVNADNSDIKVKNVDGIITVNSVRNIASVNVYNALGVLVASVSPDSSSAVIATDNFASGLYLVNVVADGGSKTVKIVK